MSGPPERAAQRAAQIDARWDFGDPRASERAFRVLLAEARASGEAGFVGQTLSQIARAQGLQRDFAAAHATLEEAQRVLDSGTGGGTGLARVRVLLERGRLHNSAGRSEDARPFFTAAWDQARALGADFYAIDAAHMIAIGKPPAEAMAWNGRALALAEASADGRARRWAGSLCNNIGWTLHGEGRAEEALPMFERALAERRRHGSARDVRIATWCVARCLRSLGQVDRALSLQEDLLLECSACGESDGFVHEEMAECLALLGRKEAARPHFAAAHAQLARDPAFSVNEAQRLRRLAVLGGIERGERPDEE